MTAVRHAVAADKEAVAQECADRLRAEMVEFGLPLDGWEFNSSGEAYHPDVAGHLYLRHLKSGDVLCQSTIGVVKRLADIELLSPAEVPREARRRRSIWWH